MKLAIRRSCKAKCLESLSQTPFIVRHLEFPADVTPFVCALPRPEIARRACAYARDDVLLSCTDTLEARQLADMVASACSVAHAPISSA